MRKIRKPMRMLHKLNRSKNKPYWGHGFGKMGYAASMNCSGPEMMQDNATQPAGQNKLSEREALPER